MGRGRITGGAGRADREHATLVGENSQLYTVKLSLISLFSLCV